MNFNGFQEDLKRAEIVVKWWVINSSYYKTKSTNKLLSIKTNNEITAAS